MSHNRIEEIEVYILAEEISDEIWNMFLTWDFFAKDTMENKFVELPIPSVRILQKDMQISL